jgi:hypothetical protein
MERKIQIGEIVERSKKLEAMLKSGGGEGRGLHELVTSIQDKLDAELNKKLRFIATIRNNAIHDLDFDIASNMESFNSACNEAETELKKIVKPKRRKSAKKPQKEAKFNYLFLLPFIPGANIIYFFFILVLSMVCGSRYIILLALYVLAFTEIIRGATENDTEEIWVGAGTLAVLYIFGIFMPSKRFPRLRYVPLLNITGIFSGLKDKVQWNLFFMANIFILLTIFSGFAIFSWNQYLLGIALFILAYIGGIVLFLYAGRKKQDETDKYGRIKRK